MTTFDWKLDSHGVDSRAVGRDGADPTAVPAPQESISPLETLSPFETLGFESVAIVQASPAVSRRELRERERVAADVTPPVVSAPAVSSNAAPARTARLQKAAPAPKTARPQKTSMASKAERSAKRSAATSASKKRLFPKLVSVAAMLGVGAFLVATSVPANAFRNSAADALGVSDLAHSTVQSQSLAVDKTVLEQAPARDAYTVISMADQTRLQGANPFFDYTNDPNGTIQWPFPTRVPISSGFGARQVENCSFCSTYHEGVDFTPGAGTPIQAIADGVVSQADTTGPFGNHVMIDHVINGQKVQSLYAHMISGSIKVTVGQQVKVTQQIGLVGATGHATGPHLHLEIHLDGTPVDPFAWLKANAN